MVGNVAFLLTSLDGLFGIANLTGLQDRSGLNNATLSDKSAAVKPVYFNIVSNDIPSFNIAPGVLVPRIANKSDYSRLKT